MTLLKKSTASMTPVLAHPLCPTTAAGATAPGHQAREAKHHSNLKSILRPRSARRPAADALDAKNNGVPQPRGPPTSSVPRRPTTQEARGEPGRGRRGGNRRRDARGARRGHSRAAHAGEPARCARRPGRSRAAGLLRPGAELHRKEWVRVHPRQNLFLVLTILV